MPDMDDLPEKSNLTDKRVLVCQHRSCLANHSDQVLAAFQAVDLSGYTVCGSSCLGQCSSGPTVQVLSDNTWYCRVQPTDVPLIVEQHLKGGEPVEALLNPRIHIRFSF